MQRLGLITAVALLALGGGGVLANDVPPPVKKPRDKTGAAMTSAKPSGDASAVKVDDKTSTGVKADAPTTGSEAGTGPPALRGAASDAPSPKPPGKEPADASRKDAKVPGTLPAGVGGKPTGAKPTDSKTVPLTGQGSPPAAQGQPATPPPPPAVWTPDEIQEAKARCIALLKGVDAVTVGEGPLREGNCGAPAPVRLMSIGKKPEVTLDPPALLTCDMVAMLATWLKSDVQPAARKHLGAEVSRIETMSDYSCRVAYGRKGNKLSEHAHANALDIRGFVTAKATEAMVLEGWGTPQREIAAARALAEKEAAQAAGIKAAAEKAAADRAASEAAAAAAYGNGQGSARTGTAAADSLPAARSSIVEGLPKGLMPRGIGDAQKGLGLAPSQLGGPKQKDSRAAPAGRSADDAVTIESQHGQSQPGDKRAPVTIVPRSPSAEPPANVVRFLHEVHNAACQRFGTTLGPEANAAHRNHFHVDMAPRQHTRICD
jgi:hypothetical protein